MANALMHKVEVVDFLSVETTEQLRSAIGYLSGRQDFNLSHTYVIELISETLSDGTKAFEVNIRKAEAA